MFSRSHVLTILEVNSYDSNEGVTPENNNNNIEGNEIYCAENIP